MCVGANLHLLALGSSGAVCVSGVAVGVYYFLGGAGHGGGSPWDLVMESLSSDGRSSHNASI